MVLIKRKRKKLKNVVSKLFELYEINLEQFNFNDLYEQIVKIVCQNEGWINNQKAVFHSIEQRDYCLLELEKDLGVGGSEIKNLKDIAKLLYDTLFQDFKNEITLKQEEELKRILLEIIMFDRRDFYYLVENPNDRVKRFRKIRKLQLIKQRPIEYHQLKSKVNKLKKRINSFHPDISDLILEMIDTIDSVSELSYKVTRLMKKD